MELIYSNTFGDIYYSKIRELMRNPVAIILSLALLTFIGFDTFRRLGPTQDGVVMKTGTVVISRVCLWFGIIVIFDLVSTLLLLLYFRWKSGSDGVYGEHKLTLDHENIIETTTVNTSQWKWKNAYSVCQDKRFIFIYLTPEQFYVIPKRAIGANSTSVFEQLMESWRLSKNAN